jgi:general secretion pathway protein C
MDAAWVVGVIPDIAFKRSFPAVICVSIAVAAYFQASGISSLLGEVALDDAPEVAPGLPLRLPAAAPSEHATSAARILARNPFDSVTGALDVKPLDLSAPPPAAIDDEHSDDDPVCDSAGVRLIVTADDEAWSFASITGPKGNHHLRRLGDEVAGRTVHAITWDRVWLTGGGPRCQVRLGDKVKLARAAAPPPAPPKGGKRSSTALPPEIAAKIQKVSEREFIVDRSALDTILEKQGELTRTTRIVPVKEGNRVTGFRLMRVAGDSLLGTLGLQTGDQIKSINGFDLTDPQKALEAYSRLRSADNLALSIQRAGKDATIDVHFR